MNLTDRARHILELYSASDRVVVEDVARELDISPDAASREVQGLADLGLLAGQRVRKITEEGKAALEGRDIPIMTPPPGQHAADEEPGGKRGDVVASEAERRRVLSEVLADRHHIEPAMLRSIIVSGVIGVGSNDSPPTPAEVFHVMAVMEQYRLDPWMKQLHAFRHRGKLQVMVGYDGWVALANRHPTYLGCEYEYSDQMVDTGDGKGLKSWEWIKATVHSEGRLPTSVYCFLDEWYVPQGRAPGPWQEKTRWRQRQKAFTLAAREHFGIALYDDTDREWLQYHQTMYTDESASMERGTLENKDQMRLQLGASLDSDQVNQAAEKVKDENAVHGRGGKDGKGDE